LEEWSGSVFQSPSPVSLQRPRPALKLSENSVTPEPGGKVVVVVVVGGAGGAYVRTSRGAVAAEVSKEVAIRLVALDVLFPVMMIASAFPGFHEFWFTICWMTGEMSTVRCAIPA
jgi:hypothetical protein